MSEKQKTVIINGEEVPVLPAKAEEEVVNKRTGQKYDSKDHFDSDVADPNTDTTVDDFQQDLEIKVAKLELVSKTKE